jgi:hypothetical protein
MHYCKDSHATHYTLCEKLFNFLILVTQNFFFANKKVVEFNKPDRPLFTLNFLAKVVDLEVKPSNDLENYTK